MARRIPPVLGLLVAYLAATDVSSSIGLAVDTLDYPEMRLVTFALAASTLLQLATGIAVALREPSRALLVAWTAATTLAAVGSARAMVGGDASPVLVAFGVVQLLVPVVFVWCAGSAAPSAASRRGELGAALAVLGVFVLLNAFVTRVSLLVDSTPVNDRYVLSNVLEFACSIVVGMLALLACRALRTADAGAAHRAVVRWATVTIATAVLQMLLTMFGQMLSGLPTAFVARVIVADSASMVFPLVAWRYARAELLADPAALPRPIVPHVFAVSIAWALLWSVPILVLGAATAVSGAAHGEMKQEHVLAVVAACLALAVANAAAARAVFAGSPGARRAAAVAFGLAFAVGAVLLTFAHADALQRTEGRGGQGGDAARRCDRHAVVAPAAG